MKKHLTKLFAILSALSILASSLLLCACSRTPNYKKYRIEKNKIDTVTVGDKEITGYFFLIKDGSAVVELCDSENNVLQSMSFPAEGNEYYTSLDFSFAFREAKFQDMNFDQYPDLYIPLSVTTPNLEGMAWLWDTEDGAFVLSEELSKLYELTVFPDEKIITSNDYASPDGIVCSEYAWKDGKLTKVNEYTVTN